MSAPRLRARIWVNGDLKMEEEIWDEDCGGNPQERARRQKQLIGLYESSGQECRLVVDDPDDLSTGPWLEYESGSLRVHRELLSL